MLRIAKRVFILAQYQLKQPLYFKPCYSLLSNVDRLKSKPKIQEKPMFIFYLIEKDVFQGEANLLLYKLEKAFTDLKQYEEKITQIDRVYPFIYLIILFEFIICRDENDGEDYKLTVDITDVGEYQIYTDYNQRAMYLYSPVSGLFKYYYDKNTEMWKSNKDEHFLLEHLTRETSKYCKAYLQVVK